MQDRYSCCPPAFSLAPQWPPTFFILESPLVALTISHYYGFFKLVEAEALLQIHSCFFSHKKTTCLAFQQPLCLAASPTKMSVAKSSAISSLRPVGHRPQGPCSQGASNMKADIQCIYSLSTHYASCPTFNAIYRLCVQQKKHITGACDIIEERYGIVLTTQREIGGHKAGVGNLSQVAGQKQTLQGMAGCTNFPPTIPFLCCCQILGIYGILIRLTPDFHSS